MDFLYSKRSTWNNEHSRRRQTPGRLTWRRATPTARSATAPPPVTASPRPSSSAERNGAQDTANSSLSLFAALQCRSTHTAPPPHRRRSSLHSSHPLAPSLCDKQLFQEDDEMVTCGCDLQATNILEPLEVGRGEQAHLAAALGHGALMISDISSSFVGYGGY